MGNKLETISIRLALDEDFETIYAIWLEGIENSFDKKAADEQAVRQKFRSNFQERQGIFNYWVAVDVNRDILGWQSLIRYSNNPFRQNTYAESSTYIAKQTRTKGVGKLLLEYMLKEAEKSELEYVIGFVSLTNVAARKITEETGWIEVGIIPPPKKGDYIFPKSFLVRPV
ncbi:GNAT family N-acetyltransferase [Pedobacter sp. KR3-3]|uniref:GNAT family N-acetyltransferase n=1 Tax=Pedobacter albus TaxID=3113905 RepID=A0ABU7I3J9_9SPHI|nr:GNAT family N-acetyltransferase [Pedobacter sp. KR3-3]MEE1944040.1 GNAT family N-acetyltransferase [Pedobacter sp. KR3-3]